MVGIINGMWLVLALFIFNFIFWNKIRHDIGRVDSVKLSWLVVLVSLSVGKSGGIIEGILGGLRGWSLIDDTEILWPVAIGVGITLLWWWHRDIKSRWQHDFEDGMLEALLWYGLFDSMRILFFSWASSKNWYMLVIFILQLVVVYIVKANFRKFKLYKSGKTGFVFWTGWIANCLLQIVGLLIWSENLIARFVYLVLYLLLLIVALVGWYKRAGRKFSEDWPGLYYWFK